jgi:hypothetical protein
MKCKVCGRELKGKGNICTYCYNEKQKQKKLDKDTNVVLEIKPKFKPIYELLKIIDFVVLGIILILALFVEGNALHIILTIVVLLALLIIWLVYRQKKLAATSMTFYDTKVVVKTKSKEKVMTYKDINDISYYQNFKQRICKMGDINLMPEHGIVIMQGLNISDVGNVVKEFEKVKEVMAEKA